MVDESQFDFIFSYTRKEAIQDGVLVDVSTMAKEAGFKFPVAVTAAVWELINNYPEGQGQSVEGRLWDLLWMLRFAIQYGAKGDTVFFQVLVVAPPKVEAVEYTFKSVVGPGDNFEPVITIMMPNED